MTKLLLRLDAWILGVHQALIDATQWKISSVLSVLSAAWAALILLAFCVEEGWFRWLILAVGLHAALVLAYAAAVPAFCKSMFMDGQLRRCYLVFAVVEITLDFITATTDSDRLLKTKICIALLVVIAEYCEFAGCQPPRPRPRKEPKLASQGT